jgi:hypothetical protein
MDVREMKYKGNMENYIMRSFTIRSSHTVRGIK